MLGWFLERGFLVVLFLYLMGAAASLLYADLDRDAYLALQGSLHGPLAVIQVCLFLVAGLLIIPRWRRVFTAAMRAWPLLVLAGLQVMSMTWSIHPWLTARKDTAEIIMLFIGIYLGERYTTAALASKLAQILCFTMIMTVCLYFVAPHFVLDASQNDALKGLSQTKNGFGFHIGLTVALLLVVQFARHDWLRYVFLALALVMLLMSHSMTSIASAGVILMTLPFWLVARLAPRQRLAAYLIAAVMIVLVGYCCVLFSNDLLALMGKDSTLTGRTQVWQQVLVAISHHPILGYGYGSFWTGLSGESLDVLIVAGWLVPAAHNAYLDMYLALGIPGSVATIAILWIVFLRAIKYIRSEGGWPGLWPVVCLMFILFHGIGESEFICDASFATCLFTALYTSLAIESPHVGSGTVHASTWGPDQTALPAPLVSG